MNSPAVVLYYKTFIALSSKIAGNCTTLFLQPKTRLITEFYQCFENVDQRVFALEKLLDAVNVDSDEYFCKLLMIIVGILEAEVQMERDYRMDTTIHKFMVFLPRAIATAECMDISVSLVILKFTSHLVSDKTVKQLLDRDHFYKLCQHVDVMLEGRIIYLRKVICSFMGRSTLRPPSQFQFSSNLYPIIHTKAPETDSTDLALTFIFFIHKSLRTND